MLNLILIVNIKLKFKIGDHVRISKYKNIFTKGYTPNQSEAFVISKMKNTVPWTYVISDLNGEEIFGTFYEKESQKANPKELEQGKYLKENETSYISNRKDMIIHLIVGLVLKTLYKMSQYFPKPCTSFGGNINVKADLSNYATKTDLKNATGTDTSNFELKSNIACLKTEANKLHKLKPVSVDLSKLRDVVNNDVVKKTVYNKLVAKVSNIDTTHFILKTKCNTHK